MASAAPQAQIDVGRVLSCGFDALRGNFLPFLAASLLLAGIPGFALQYWAFSNVNPSDPAVLLSPIYWIGAGVGVILGLVASVVLQGVLVRSTILYLSGRDPDLGASALLALRLVLPLIGLSLALVVLIGLGFLLLVVPGIMIYCATIVAVPALIEERSGVFGSIGRSRALTRGSRWQVFLLIVLFWIFGVVVQNIVGLFAGVTKLDLSRPLAIDPVAAGLAGGLSSTLTTMVVAVLLAALYVELREVKEGATANDLADIFA